MKLSNFANICEIFRTIRRTTCDGITSVKN